MSNSIGISDPERVASFLAERRVMIVDSCAAARSSYIKSLKDLGAKPSKTTVLSSYDDAIRDIERLKPNLIVCDYRLGSACGLSLIPKHRELVPEPGERIFILVTGNSRESTIAEAAEEDVDGYVLKPFTLAVLHDHFLSSILSKVNPSPYRRALDTGRALLSQSQLDQAFTSFSDAAKLHTKPCMAHYYLGQTQFQRKSLPAADQSFDEGLKFNELHYRCLTGKLELYLEQQKMDVAYDVGQKIVFNFPLSPQRLDQVLRMCVRTKMFDDIEKYYDLYLGVEYRTPELTKCMIAALLVGGRYHLLKHQVLLARSLFEKGLSVSGRSLSLIREIIGAFVGQKEYEHANQFIKFIPGENQGEPLALALELLVFDGFGTDSQVIDKGRKLLEKGTPDPLVYEVLIRRSMQAGLRPAAESYAYDAAKKWPESREKFVGLLGATA